MASAASSSNVSMRRFEDIFGGRDGSVEWDGPVERDFPRDDRVFAGMESKSIGMCEGAQG